MHDKAKSFVFYSIVALVGIMLHYWFSSLNSTILEILLYPHAKLTEIYYNLPMSYQEGFGYLAADGTFAIGRECMGSSFIIMLFTMTSALFSKHFPGVRKYIWLIICLVGSAVIGILVSCIRILGSVPFIANPKFGLFHSSIGISLYFITLLASYAFLEIIFRGERSEEGI